METEKTTMTVQQEKKIPEQPAWYDPLINIFQKLLETSNFAYGIKKQF